jgi:transposase-like protein
VAKRKHYDKAFKMAAVQQWEESGKSAAEMAEELDISTSSLYTWRDQYADELAFADEQATGDEPLASDERVAEPIAEPAAEAPEATEAETDIESAQPEKVEAVDPLTEAGEQQAPVEEPVKEQPVEEKVGAKEGAAVAVAVTSATEPEIEEPKKGGAKVIVKRILGGVGAFLGGLGLILSIAFIIVVWVVNKPVTEGTVELVGKIEIGLTVANNGLDQADDTLNNVRQQIRDLTEAVPLEGLQSTITDIIALVDGIKTTVDTAASVVGLADTFPVSLLRRDAEPVDTPKLDEASNTLGQISTSLGNVEVLLQERQDSGLGPVGTQVDTQIDDLQTRIQDVNQGVEEGVATTVQLQEDLPGIIDTIAIVITLLLIWLGVAQYALLVNGWHWVRWP